MRLTQEDKEWIYQRAQDLTLRPTVYARMLLSKAIEIDKRDPGALLR